MNPLYAFLMETVFPGFLQRSPELLGALEGCAGDIELRGEELVFTLPALHGVVSRLYIGEGGAPLEQEAGSYQRFRKALYAHPTNDWLREWGGRVEVASVHRDHHRSRYKLVRIAVEAERADHD